MALSASSPQVISYTHNSATLRANVADTSTVKLKIRLYQGGSMVQEQLSSGQGTGGHSMTFYGLNPSTPYTWQYQAIEASGSPYTIFYTNAPGFTTNSPPVLNPYAPSNLSTGSPGTTSISYQGVVSHPSGLNCYLNAQVYSDSNYSNYVTSFNTSFVGSGSFASGTMSGLTPGTTYWWRAYTTDSNFNNSSSVNVGSFTLIDNKPDPPVSLSTGTPTTNSIDFGGYVFHDLGYSTRIIAEVYTNSSYTNLFNTFYTGYGSNGASVSGTFTGLSPGTTYYWKARANDINGAYSSYVTVGSFTTALDRNPNNPTNLSHSVLTSTTVQFSGTVTDLDGQQLYLKAYVYQDAGLTQQVGLTDGYIGSLTTSGGTSTGTINGLAMAKQYWWTAQTVDNGGAKASSRVYAGTFKTRADWRWITAIDASGNKVAGQNFSMLASEWNSFTGMINQVRNANGYMSWPFTVATQNSYFYYNIFNEAISAINNMLGTGISPKVKGDTCWAGDFNALKNTLNNVGG